jgi:NADPH:quinone reductase
MHSVKRDGGVAGSDVDDSCHDEGMTMRVAQALALDGIGSVEVAERPDPVAGPGQVLIRVRGAGVGPWDVGFVNGGFPGITPPWVPGQEVAGIVEATGEGADFKPGDKVYATLFPAGGGFAELAVASADRAAPMPAKASFEEAAGLVIGAGTAYDALVERGQLQAGQTVLITAAAGGVGSAAVQIAAAVGAHAYGVASKANHHYLRGLGVIESFDYHDTDWVGQVLAAVPGGVDLLLDATGGQTRDQAIGAVRDGGRVISIIPREPLTELERGITGEAFASRGTGQRLEALGRLVDDGKLHPQVSAVLPLDDAREALAHVARGHTRGKVVLRIGQ